MKQLFFAIIFASLLSSAGATPPPPSYYGTQEVHLEDFLHFDKFKKELKAEIYDIVNPYGEVAINCNDWSLLWYLKFNGSERPRRARIFCNNVIHHTFVGVNVEGKWFYIDAQTCLPMGHPSLKDYGYDESDNWEFTDFILSAWYSCDVGDADLWYDLRCEQGME